MFLAPFNSMTQNIGGQTVHSFGGIAFKDAEGRTITPNQNDQDVPTNTVRYSALRFVFIDECEATGVHTISEIESNIRMHIPHKKL